MSLVSPTHTSTTARQEAGAHALLRVLLYFDLFRHPLTTEELTEMSPRKNTTRTETEELVKQMEEKGWVFVHHGMVMLHDDAELALRRKRGSELAAAHMPKAGRVSRFISCYPFVRGVLLSGSMSKGYMDANSDIDYFIITEQKRLWVCRSMLAITRKLMPGRMRRNFCINYFIDNSTLEIPDKNLFTATELLYIRPMYNISIYRQLLHANNWIQNYYPNAPARTYEVAGHISGWHTLKRSIEKLLGGRLGEWLDTFLFRKMVKRWKARYTNLDEQDLDLNFRTRRNSAKQHEKSHQTVIMQRYAQRVAQFEHQHQITLT